MYRAKFQARLDDPWRFMDPIRIGRVPTGEPEPAAYVTVDRDGAPFARIDVYGHAGPFTELITWGKFVLLGWDVVAYLVDPFARQVRRVECDFYFGRLYPLADRLLIASASELICLDDRGDVVWRRGDLGVDGVTVASTSDGVIRGEGEWDPPGGWRPFQLSLATGVPVTG